MAVPTRAPFPSLDEAALEKIRGWLRADAQSESDVRRLVVAADADVPASRIDALRGVAPEGYETVVMVGGPRHSVEFVPWPDGGHAGTVADVVAAATVECGLE